MSDLEPITRDEMLWSGEDLEPITRKEQYIKHLYDETQVVPKYPKTREEYFINKAGEELHDVTVEQLNVTENGTYSEAGKAYSPVIVEVPEPTLISKSISENGTYNASADNADGYSSVDVNVSGYKISEVSGLPSPIASFNGASSLPMPNLKIAVEPVQEGSGDPSPTNIRPISGWSAVDVTVADDVDNPTTTETITIQLGDTYYGGKVDLVSGVMTVTHKLLTMSDITWLYSDSLEIFYATLSDYKKTSTTTKPNAECEVFNVVGRNKVLTDRENGLTFGNVGEYDNRILVRESSFTDLPTFESAISGKKLVYELATPTTIQLTPTAVKSLLGTNNLFADTGDVVEASYWESL